MPGLEIQATASWTVHWGGINHLGGVDGQVTKCRHNRVIFYVRENIAFDHFHMSSGERQGLKAGRLSRRHPQVLELLAPVTLWHQFAALVRQVDRLDRPVRHNRRFTWLWAEALFASNPDSHSPLGVQTMRVIEVTVTPKGETTVQTRGYAGGDCLQASKFLEQTLGVVASDRKTAEFFAAQATELRVQQ